MKRLLLIFITALLFLTSRAEDGYRLWLRYDLISDQALLQAYNKQVSGIFLTGDSPSLLAAREELTTGLGGLLGHQVRWQQQLISGSVILGTPKSSPLIASLLTAEQKAKAGNEGFILLTSKLNGHQVTIIAGNTDIGVLYGTFRFLRLLQTHQPLTSLAIVSAPKIKLRLLNHWDNVNRTVERGYAGMSIWDWHRLPLYIDQRYKDYARANASIGINGTVLTNVNANTIMLTKDYLIKVAALANVFRPYGIKVYLTAKFSSPIEIGGLKTADPLDPAVRNWWKQKVDEIYHYIPDFGGFLIKANSEGQPGPQNYGRSHADGANLFAEALEPHGGIVMWRAFVYSGATPDDRFKQAYNEFKPLDGQFRKNVLLQVKNGPIDFQPREPYHPLFGSMPRTPLVMEFQVTQEYLGQATHLVYEAPLFKETLDADTYERGTGSTVAKVIEGNLEGHDLSGMAGVSNIGSEINWTGHLFGQANWYALGRLSWEPDAGAATIADEWIRQTFTNEPVFVETVEHMMEASREILVDYMAPLGLHHVMGYSHHYGPAPWYNKAPRADWNPTYYHRADSFGIGFDRTAAGSNALAQYPEQVRRQFENPRTCPEAYLLWFHHVSWDFKMKSGKTLWEELCYKYYTGVDSVRWMQRTWDQLERYVDKERFQQVRMLLSIQEQEAIWWRNASVLYFQTFSKRPLPQGYERPDHTLAYYESLQFPYAPGIGGNL